MAKKLKLWNGRGYIPKTHLYICAHSKADAVRMLLEIYPARGWLYEINNYYSPDCWGDAMDNITPERGIWLTQEQDREASPVRMDIGGAMNTKKDKDPRTFSEGVEKKGGLNPGPTTDRPTTPPPPQPKSKPVKAKSQRLGIASLCRTCETKFRGGGMECPACLEQRLLLAESASSPEPVTMKTLKIEIHGLGISDLEVALERIKDQVSTGFLSGSDRNETGRYNFYITED